MHIDYVVERCSSPAFFPNVTGQHFAGYNAVMVARQVFQKLKLAGREIDAPTFPVDRPFDRVDFKPGNGEDTWGSLWLIATKEGPKARAQLGKSERLHQVVASPSV
jgi:hypothetical protein